MLIHPLSLYEEILECLVGQKPVNYGNAVRGKMEFTQSSEKRGLTNKEMKITFNEYCAFHPSTYQDYE